ncbi:hypothetical protein ACFO5R_18725 [Halosolutus amylolyticus]|uniref:Uncharacterized protein n=1 Tax=Halosolutus amylolyticus TaxID=2932267 RepID=A0ABD5PTK7_9EURY|nr:hypothetical protein [Halosolutus amylolyticus]
MSSRRAVALLVLATVVGLTIAPIGSGAVVGSITETDTADETASNTTVSTFMQASTADAENTVDEGMFEARYEAADDERKAAVVAERTDALEAKLAALEDERQTLRDQRDDLSNGQYRARMAKLTVEIAGLERSIEQTSPRAAEAGVDEKRLETLQQNASDLVGPEVAEMARGMPGTDRVPGQGPPDDRGAGSPTGNDQSSQENPGNGEPPGQTGDTGKDGSGGSPPDDTPGSNQDDGEEAESGTENDDRDQPENDGDGNAD